jgi:hypothetical protein
MQKRRVLTIARYRRPTVHASDGTFGSGIARLCLSQKGGLLSRLRAFFGSRPSTRATVCVLFGAAWGAKYDPSFVSIAVFA